MCDRIIEKVAFCAFPVAKKNRFPCSWFEFSVMVKQGRRIGKTTKDSHMAKAGRNRMEFFVWRVVV